MGKIGHSKYIPTLIMRLHRFDYCAFLFIASQELGQVRLLLSDTIIILLTSFPVLNMHELAVTSGFAAAYQLGADFPFHGDEECERLFKLYLGLSHGSRMVGNCVPILLLLKLNSYVHVHSVKKIERASLHDFFLISTR
jgi:hypothetical protein